MSDLTASVPPWALPALLALVGGGAVGRATAPTSDPSVLAEALTALRADVHELRGKIGSLEVLVASGSSDRWTGSDHAAWVRTDVEPLRERLRQLELRVREIEVTPTR